jgi:methyl-accepting chemotaxis protein
MLSLIWTYFEKSGSSKVDRNIYEMEKIYDGRVWKESELIKHRHMQSELKDQQIVETLKETFNLNFIKDLNEQYMKSFRTILDDTSNSFNQLADHMQSASLELRETLDKIHQRQESINAVSMIKENIEGFNTNAKNLQKAMERFDGTVDHTFDKIDSEVGQIVEKLSSFARIISEQNQMILQNLTLQREEKEDKK